MPQYKLSYFDANARAEVARLILSYNKVDFEDHRFSGAEWPAIKPDMPFGQVPVLYIDGTPLTESGAIVRYLATEYGMNGANSLQAAYIEMISGILGDIYMKVPYFEKDPVEKEKKMKSAFDDHICPGLAKMEKKFAERGNDFLIGDKYSYADFAMANCLLLTEVHDASYLKAYPKLCALKDRVKNLEGVKEYYAKHPPKGFKIDI